MIKKILNKDQILAIIIPSDFSESGVKFFTPDEFSQQLAYIRHPAGKIIEPHIHRAVQREIFYTQEVLIIKRGKLRVDFYDNSNIYLSCNQT